jgi:hypothetical protein
MSSLNTIRVFFPLLDKSVMVEAGKQLLKPALWSVFRKTWFAGAKEPVKNALLPFVKTI